MFYYTYAHYRSDDGKLFYIGKGNSRGNRHSSSRNRNQHWHRVVNKHGFRVEILAHWKNEIEAFDHEKVLIRTFRELGYPLTNITDGGEGTSGMKLSDERKEKIKRDHLTRDYDSIFTPESRAKIVARHRGKIVSAETRVKIGNARRGFAVSEETRQKLRNVVVGKQSPKRWKSIYLDGYDVIFKNLSLASAITGVSQSMISSCCNGKVSHAKGFHFKHL